MGQWHQRSTPKLREANPRLEADVAIKAHGLARDLIKLIANLTAKNKVNQDLVRLEEVRSCSCAQRSWLDTRAWVRIGYSSCFVTILA
jgi:hypothetical protein